MKINRLRLITFILIICLTLPVINVSAATNAVSVTMSRVGDAYLGGEFVVKIAVPKPSKALSGLEFTLAYDSEYVTPKYTTNTESGKEMDVFMKSKPSGWEQFCSHSAKDSLYNLRFVMPESGTSYLDKANELVLEIPFTVKTPGSFSFTIDSKDILAFGTDSAVTAYTGTGSVLNVTAASEGVKISATLNGNDSAEDKGTYNLGIDITNLGDASGIIAVQFDVYYNKSIFEPVVKSNTQTEMNQFLVSTPQSAWEQMCTLYQTEGKYTIRLAANNLDDPSKAEILATGADIKLSIPFKVIGSQGSVGEFKITSDSILGLNNLMASVSGTGDIKDVSVTAPTKFTPEELGYEIKDGCLLYVRPETDISEFLAPMKSGYSVLSDGKKVTSGYVCTGQTLSDGNGNDVFIVVKGDVNGTGDVNVFDCLMVKYIYFDRYTPSTYEKYAGDVSPNGTINVFDYRMIKSHYFGTYDMFA